MLMDARYEADKSKIPLRAYQFDKVFIYAISIAIESITLCASPIVLSKRLPTHYLSLSLGLSSL